MTDLSITDLNTEINHVPRVLDLEIARRLGMTDPHSIRRMIEANRAELESYGPISDRQSEIRGRGRRGREYWLNEGQALVLCALSRTPKAAEVRKAIIDVYMAWRQQQVPGFPDDETRRLMALYLAALEHAGAKIDADDRRSRLALADAAARRPAYKALLDGKDSTEALHTGRYDKDVFTGETLAWRTMRRMSEQFVESDGASIYLLGDVVRDMVKHGRFEGVQVGFFEALGHAAMRGAYANHAR